MAGIIDCRTTGDDRRSVSPAMNAARSASPYGVAAKPVDALAAVPDQDEVAIDVAASRRSVCQAAASPFAPPTKMARPLVNSRRPDGCPGSSGIDAGAV